LFNILRNELVQIQNQLQINRDNLITWPGSSLTSYSRNVSGFCNSFRSFSRTFHADKDVRY